MDKPISNGQMAKTSYRLNVAMWVVGVAITILAGYTSVTLTRGRDAQRMLTMENEIKELKLEREYNRVHYVTYDEFKRYLDGQTKQLDRIEDNVNKMR